MKFDIELNKNELAVLMMAMAQASYDLANVGTKECDDKAKAVTKLFYKFSDFILEHENEFKTSSDLSVQ